MHDARWDSDASRWNEQRFFGISRAMNSGGGGRTMDLAEIAQLAEARQARSVAVLADEAEPIAGGIMCFAGVGSWANQAMGLGMNGPVEPAEIDRLVRFYESRGVEPKIELCPFAHETLVRGLAERSFVLREFENVLALDLRSVPPLPEMPRGIEIVPLDPADERLADSYITIMLEGVAPADPQQLTRSLRRMFNAPGYHGFLAMIDGEVAATGTCHIDGPSAALVGVATLDRFRRRGCQQAMMIHRLRLAMDAGCRYAFVHSNPLIATGRNAMRLGFQIAFTKSILARPGPGLAPSP